VGREGPRHQLHLQRGTNLTFLNETTHWQCQWQCRSATASHSASGTASEPWWVDPFKAFAGQTGAAPRSSWCRGRGKVTNRQTVVITHLAIASPPVHPIPIILDPFLFYFMEFDVYEVYECFGGCGGGGLGGICCFLGRQQRLADLHQVYGGLSGRHRGLGSRCKRSPLHFGRISQDQLDGIDVRPYRAGEDEGDDEEDGAVGGGRRGA